MSIQFFTEGIKYSRKNRNDKKRLINDVIAQEERKCGEINIIITTDDYLLNLNKTFLKRDSLTDIITFNFNQDETLSGELYISLERIRENSKKYNCTVEEEMARVIIHGILHLIGYEDNDKTSKARMRRKESEYLKKRL